MKLLAEKIILSLKICQVSMMTIKIIHMCLIKKFSGFHLLRLS